MNNIYPSWWEDTITVYNKYIDADKKITWYRTVIPNCFWKYLSAGVITRHSSTNYHTIRLETNIVTCRIPKDKKYLSNKDWNNSESRSEYFTLSVGDVIVRGECVDEINEYESGNRSSDFLKLHKAQGEAFTVGSVSINTGTDKCCEHYLISGE